MQDIPSPPGSYFALAGDTIGCCYPRAWNSSQEYDHEVTVPMQSQYLKETRDIVADLETFPSVITFILFNEVCYSSFSCLYPRIGMEGGAEASCCNCKQSLYQCTWKAVPFPKLGQKLRQAEVSTMCATCSRPKLSC